MSIEIGGFFGFILLALDVWAIVSLLSIKTSKTSKAAKVAWILTIIVLPLLGFIAWCILGPRSLDTDIEW